MPASKAIDDTAESVDQTLKDAEKQLNELTEQARKTIQEGIETLRSHAQVYAGQAGDQLDVAQKYMTERVQERPLTATFAALGVGVLIGLLLAAGGRR
jgi:ElaB/YqjD/DUF883 family membrane-anchored ribosome-binding protein